MRVLVVDDESLITYAVKRYFEARGFRVDCAAGLKEALLLLEGCPYAAAVVDLRLSGGRGIEGLELLGQIAQRCPATRTLLLTLYATEELVAEARRRGADEVLPKPQSLSRLLSHVVRLVGASPE